MIYDKAVWEYEISPGVKKLRAKHVEELSSKQKGKIKELRSRLKEELEPHHDDFFLLKWIIAKKWDVNVAENMLRTHLKWYKEWRVDHIYHEYSPTEVCDKYVPFGHVGEDKDGRPFYILTFGLVDLIGLVSSQTLGEVLRYATYNLEYGARIQTMQTEKHGKVINSYMAILDMEHFHYGVIVWKSVMELIISLCRLIEEHYPGIIGKLFIINTSTIFTVLYSMLRPFIRDDTRQRIFIYKKDLWKEHLLNHVDLDQLPVRWGGYLVDKIDGSPNCAKQIGLGGPIPKSLYMGASKELLKNNYLSVTVGGRSTLKVEVEVPKERSTMLYSFCTEKHDIAFGIDLGKVHFLPVKKYSCQLVPEKGQLECEQSGTYKLVFDNTHSLYKSKKVFYKVQILSADENDAEDY